MISGMWTHSYTDEYERHIERQRAEIAMRQSRQGLFVAHSPNFLGSPLAAQTFPERKEEVPKDEDILLLTEEEEEL